VAPYLWLMEAITVKLVLPWSGGADSTAALLKLMDAKYEVIPVFYDYGQNNMWAEHDMVVRMAEKLGIEVEIKTLSIWPVQDKVITNKDAFIPLRNTIFMLCAMASHPEADGVAFGYMKNDEGVFFDNSLEHHMLIQDLINKSLRDELVVVLPLRKMTKAEVLKYLDEKGFLDLTVSCWNAKVVDGEIHYCGECANCKERKEEMKWKEKFGRK